MLAKGIGKFIGKGMGKVGDMMKRKEPDLDLKEAIADLQKRFNYSIYDGNYKPQGGVVSEPKNLVVEEVILLLDLYLQYLHFPLLVNL